MAAVPRNIPKNTLKQRPPELLRNGDRMTRSDFHIAYAQMPPAYRAELIGGIVFEPSPLGWPHGDAHVQLSFLLETYSRATPGTRVGDNVTVFLSEDDEVQPDLVMRRVAESLGMSKGRTRLTKKGYVKGAPELVAEIAHSSRAIDLHLKKDRYALAGVLEYVVVCLQPKRVYWFDLPNNKELPTDIDGIVRSEVFPGLWINAEALLEGDRDLALATLNRGLQGRSSGI